MIGANLLAVFLHWLDNAVEMEKGLILDFVGLSESGLASEAGNHDQGRADRSKPFRLLETRPSLTQVLLIDLFMVFYQLSTLYVAYLADPLPYGSADKLLQPPRKTSRSSSRRSRKTGTARQEDQAGLGLGLDIERRSELEEVDLGRDEDDDMDLDDDYERQALLRQGELYSSAGMLACRPCRRRPIPS